MKYLCWFLILLISSLSCVATLPRPSDVCVTSRSVHNGPIGNNNTHPLMNTSQAASGFRATRLDWVYTVSREFIEYSSSQGWPVTATINANVPDRVAGPASYNVGRIVNLTGHKLTAPWMRAFPEPLPYYGCVNNPDYRDIVFSRAAMLVNSGAAGIQHDDPHCNYEAVNWPEGGCYCDHCMQQFTEYLLSEHYLPENASGHLFNYRTYLLNQGGYGHGAPALRQHFIDFQLRSVVHYVKNLTTNLTSSFGKHVVMSCNNGATLWDNVTSLFDYGMGELAATDATPDILHSVFLTRVSGGNVPEGKAQVTTMPKKPSIDGFDKVLTRKTIALAYGLNGHVLAPWDIYLPTPHAARFFGNLTDYNDLYDTVHYHSEVMEDCSAIQHTWAAGASVFSANASNVYWTVHKCQSDNRSSAEFLVHVVDWSWACEVEEACPQISYPLPVNPGRSLVFALNTSSLFLTNSRGSRRKTSNTANPVSAPTAVELLLVNGTRLPIPYSWDNAVVSFPSARRLVPWGMFWIQFQSRGK